MNTNIVIIGAGRLGRSVAHILDQKGHSFSLIGRGESIPEGPVTWLTVPDREIAHVASAVPKGGVVLHASGALTTAPLSGHVHAGSLHPLMTFPGPEFGIPNETHIPAAVAGDTEAVTAAKTLAEWLGFTPFEVPGNRALYHAAAVTAGNFASLLLIEAGKILAKAGVPDTDSRTLLLPLAMASLKSAAQHGPDALTGPIARADEHVINDHLDALNLVDHHMSDLYRELAEATRRIKKPNAKV